ncbi:uncharacterized protein TRIADDRAFT_57929 [Trichoplax adhaerens]|uniref:UDP-glucose 4-epimerase n=1 Tax=Trichoplax adhaerens TaxID=10228 RepID=B3S253_TRIAD|nr:hypothetical protein TRIADDRAFT_57929 [Trichoplax adhaerens]EDV23054.1 hypothetical protein TRIADDRAFT_57929 [Trichoplax adhaerens]|eukprot:XP_002113964.1 hypothetical protein TRIADDRAFT_57929 [Trichoplax adhaerens]
MANSKEILVLGGAGYIGSHTIVELVKAGYQPVVADNAFNSSPECVTRIQNLLDRKIEFYQVDMRDKEGLRNVFSKHNFYAVIHLAGLKAVGESVQIPLSYYSINIGGTISLLEVMKEFKVFNIAFSSSAAVYGDPQFLPITEDHPTGRCANPYGRTKYFIEEIFKDLCKAEPEWNVFLLRYFNPVGAHESGVIGEDPRGIPNNLMPYVSQVCVGKREYLTIFGNDYDTHDGTGVRDYVHVVDLAAAHALAIDKMEGEHGCKIYNLGSGKGISVLDIIKEFEKASGNKVPYKIVDRRPGDVPKSYADVSLAEKELGWKTMKNLQEMCEDTWKWQSGNPSGFLKN